MPAVKMLVIAQSGEKCQKYNHGFTATSVRHMQYIHYIELVCSIVVCTTLCVIYHTNYCLHIMHSPFSVAVVLLALGRSCFCPYASEGTPNIWVNWSVINRTIIQQNPIRAHNSRYILYELIFMTAPILNAIDNLSTCAMRILSEQSFLGYIII